MSIFIPQSISKLIIFFFYFVIFLNYEGIARESSSLHLLKYQTSVFILPSGEEFKVYIARTPEQQKLGLSKIRSSNFSESEGMLFPAKKMFMRQFWMPETYFDLDIFFMNEDYYIIDIHRGLKHYPKKVRNKTEKARVDISKEVFSQHVLELRSGSSLAKKIVPGMLLKMKSLSL